jgi:fluoride exporter
MSSEQLPLTFRTVIGRKLALRGAALSTTVAIVAASARAADAYFWVAIGGAIGSMARHWNTVVANALFGVGFPWGTLFINILGSFVIGFFFAITGPSGRLDASVNARLFVMTGILGGYTTFSAFSLQTLSLFQEGAWLRSGAYVAASVVICLIAVWAGFALAIAVSGAGERP